MTWEQEQGVRCLWKCQSLPCLDDGDGDGVLEHDRPPYEDHVGWSDIDLGIV